MPNHHCQAPGCGGCVPAGAERCARHTNPDAIDDAGDVLEEGIGAIRHLLFRLLNEVKDLDVQAKYIPRVSSLAIQAARARHQIGDHGQTGLMAVIRPILEDLEKDLEDNLEKDTGS